MIKYILQTALIFSIGVLYGQQQERPLPPNINQPSLNLFAPYISGDGKTLVYLSDYTDDGYHTMYFASREGFEWDDPKEVNSLINRPKLNFWGGYSLSYNGDQLYYSSRKSGLGGFDIWMSDRNGNDWKAPKNLGSPLNSSENEASPVITPDGEYLYFMRCEKMSAYGGAENCRIMVAQWNYTRWGEPEPLPANINTGNSQTPRILGDGETLLFSSDKFGAEGNLDVYITQKTAGGWTEPVPFDFVNSPNNDAFISIPAKGRYVYLSRKGRKDYELVERLIPEKFQPERVMRITGRLTSPDPARLLVFNIAERDRLWNENVTTGEPFSVILKEGNTYDVSITSDKPGYGYYSKIYDLAEIGRIDREALTIKLKPVTSGDTLSAIVSFDSIEVIRDQYTFELRRIADFIKANKALNMELQIIQYAYREDSLLQPDLTEIRYDTLWTPVQDTSRITAQTDSTIVQTWDYNENPLEIEGRKLIDSGDSLEIVSLKGDTLRFGKCHFTVKKTFHNNRTEIYTEKLTQFLLERSVDTARVKFKPILVPAETNSELPYKEPEIKKEGLVAIVRTGW